MEAEEPSLWDTLDDQTICNIISKVSNFQDLLNYIQSSEKVRAVAPTCVESLDSDSVIEVDLDLLAGYRSLQSVGGNIHLMITRKNINLGSTLPYLQKADFYFDALNSELVLEQMLHITDQLDLPVKIPQVNFRIVRFGSALFIQGNQFMVLGLQSRNPGLISEIGRRYPQLLYFDSRILGQNFGDPQLISRMMETFLREGDFGLVDPIQPPSTNNPPLSLYLSRLADSGISSIVLLKTILTIYVKYNGLYRRQNHTISMDNLMKKCFLKTMESITSRELAGTGIRLQIPVDDLTISYLQSIAIHNTIADVPRYLYGISEYDIPILLDPREEVVINQAIESARIVYEQQGFNQPLQIYSTNGTQRTI